ncbi:MAG: hypothetical protein ACREUC_17705 [Steroidobacteraceae bacterium]
MPFVNDDTIANAESLLRRVPGRWWVYDDNLGRRRPTTAAFDDIEMSVALETTLRARGYPPTAVLNSHEGFGLVSITAGLAREHGQAVARDPLPDDPAHAIVYGRKTDAARKRFSRECVCIVDPAA